MSSAQTKQYKERPGPFQYARKTSMRAVFFATFIFLYAPISTMIGA